MVKLTRRERRTRSKKPLETLERVREGLERMEENSPRGTPDDPGSLTHKTIARDTVHDIQELPQNGRDEHVDEMNVHRQYPDQGGRKGEELKVKVDGGDWDRRNNAESIENEGKGCRTVAEASGRRYDLKRER